MYWILETDCPGESAGSISSQGPFKTIDAAKAWIVNDTRDSYLGSDRSLREDDGIPWAADKIIVKQLMTLQATPTVTVAVRLSKVKP